MSLPLSLARHIAAVGCPCTIRQLCEAFPALSYKQIDCACWRAARAGWLKRERFDKRSIAYAPGVIDEHSAYISAAQVRPHYVSAIRKAAMKPPVAQVRREPAPVGIPASVWDLAAYGWPAARKPLNYWPAEELAGAE